MDPNMIANTRVGLAYLYANTHPFLTEEITAAFLIYLMTNSAPVILPEIAATTSATGTTAIAPAIPAIISVLTAQTAISLPRCINDINGTRFIPNLLINSQFLTHEELNDLDRDHCFSCFCWC